MTGACEVDSVMTGAVRAAEVQPAVVITAQTQTTVSPSIDLHTRKSWHDRPRSYGRELSRHRRKGTKSGRCVHAKRHATRQISAARTAPDPCGMSRLTKDRISVTVVQRSAGVAFGQ